MGFTRVNIWIGRRRIKERIKLRGEVLSYLRIPKWLLQLLLFPLSLLLSKPIAQFPKPLQNPISPFLNASLLNHTTSLSNLISHNACLYYPFPNPLNLQSQSLSPSLMFLQLSPSLIPLKLSKLPRGKRVFSQL